VSNPVEVKKSSKGWDVTLEGYTEASAAGAYLWPKGIPAGITVTPLIVVTEPSQVGEFEITGLTINALESMEPAVASRIADASVMTADDGSSGDSGSADHSGGATDGTAPKVDIHLDETTKEQIEEWIKEGLDGTHEIADVAEVTTYLAKAVANATGVPVAESSFAEVAAGEGASSVGEAAAAVAEALEVVNAALGPIGGIALVVWVGFEVVEAFKSERRSEVIQGFAYGTMWQALNEPDHLPKFAPGLTYSADELQEAFVEGVANGRDKARDVVTRNKIILAVARESLRSDLPLDAAQQVLSAIWRANREHSPGDSDTDYIVWPQPSDRTVLGN
jgi:hypothetical protein